MSNAPTFVDAMLGGWQLSGINNMRMGRPINLRYATSGPTPVTSGLANFLGGVSLRPNVIGNPMAPESVRSIDNYFNVQNVVIPPATQPFGNAGRNIVRGTAFYQLDLGLEKKFRVYREGMEIQFRAEAFNFFNHTQFGQPTGAGLPTGAISSPSFGRMSV